MRNLLAATVVLGGLFVGSAKAEECVDVNLILAVDSSGSIDAFEWGQQMSGYQAAFFDKKIIDLIIGGPCGAIAITVVRWGAWEHQYQEIGWTIINDAESAQEFGASLGSLPHKKLKGTDIFQAILFSLELFDSAPMQAEKLVIDVSGDGESTLLAVEYTCARVKRMGAVVNGLPIINDRPDSKLSFGASDDGLSNIGLSKEYVATFYEKNVICGFGAFIEPAYGFENFAEAIKRKLQRELVAALE
jgi:hypothetical protein